MSAYLNAGTNVACSTRVHNMKGELKIWVSDFRGKLMAQTWEESLENGLSHRPLYVSAFLERGNREMTQVIWLFLPA